MKIEIKHRWNMDVLFTAEISDDTDEKFRMRAALEVAVKARADLSWADLSRANLSRADLSRADLSGANLSGANLSGAIYDGPQPATKEESIANLDKVGAIILDNEKLLNMGQWHDDDKWKNRTCAEEAVCGTTHCLAGWLQVCSTDEKIRAMVPNLAGALCAPVAAKMFFKEPDEVIEWLRERKYVQESA